ncbi:hypothetical protein ACYA8N_04500, partial [Klebsiella pneumoniae]
SSTTSDGRQSRVLEILTAPQQGAFVKEDGEPVIDAAGQRVK